MRRVLLFLNNILNTLLFVLLPTFEWLIRKTFYAVNISPLERLLYSLYMIIHTLNKSCYISLQVLHAKQGQGHGVNLDVCFGKEDPTTFFNDGIRKIDFVLVVEENVSDFKRESDVGPGDGFNPNDNVDDSSK